MQSTIQFSFMSHQKYYPLAIADDNKYTPIESYHDGSSITDSNELHSSHLYRNVDLLYKFTPKPNFPNLPCFSTQSNASLIQCIVSEQSFVLLNRKDNNWHYLISGRLEGWVQLDESYFADSGPLRRVDKLVLYEDWKGNALFLFNGAVMLGPDYKYFFAANLMYIAVFFAYINSVVSYMTDRKIIEVKFFYYLNHLSQYFFFFSFFVKCIFLGCFYNLIFVFYGKFLVLCFN